jgi:uncharacterized linocin/CFP29 family protein
MEHGHGNVQLDVLTFGGGGMQASGSLAGALLRSGMNVNALRTNDLLGYDEWKKFDDVAVKEARERTQVIEMLQRRNLVYGGFNGLAQTVLAYQDLNDPFTAEMSMDGRTQAQQDRPVTGINYLPLPIIHCDFWYSIRELNMSRNGIAPLDTTSIETATRRVIEKAEELVLTGDWGALARSNAEIKGLTQHGDRNTGSLGGNWNDNSAVDGESIKNDVLNMKQDAIDARHYGPYGLIVPGNFESRLDDDYYTSSWFSSKTIRERIKAIGGIEEVLVADKLTDDNVVLVQLTTDVIRLVEGLSPTVVQWKTEGGMVANFKVMAIWVPQIRSTQGSRSGVVHYS